MELFYCEHVKKSIASVVVGILNLFCPLMSTLDQTWSLSDPIVCSLAVPKTRRKIPKPTEAFQPQMMCDTWDLVMESIHQWHCRKKGDLLYNSESLVCHNVSSREKLVGKDESM